MPSQRRPAPRAILITLLLLALGLIAGAAGAAPTAQDSPPATPTGEPTPTATDEPTATASPTTASPTAASPAVPASPTAEPAPAATLEPTTAATTTPAATAPAAAPAQTVQLAISKTLAGSDVVQVGQYLTFTIRITNTGAAVVTDLPLVDEFDPGVLQPATDRTSPPPTTSSPGVLRWADLTTVFGDLEPGRSVTVTAVFRATRIVDEVINRARVETGLGSGGGGGGSFEDDAGGSVEGGSVTVAKTLVESFINLDAPVISFTLALRNDGFTDIVRAPLVDTYRADLLSFIGASVPPDAHNPATGELRWDNLLAGLGVPRLRPSETVSFTTVYSVTGPIEDAVVNGFNAVDVVDEFGNRVASPRRAEVRIRIAGLGEATPTPTPEERRRPERTPTPSATALTPTVTAPTPVAATPSGEAATPTPAAPTPTTAVTAATPGAGPAGGAGPATLPATGAAGAPALPWLIALLAAGAGLALLGGAGGRGRR